MPVEKNIDDYISNAPADKQEMLGAIRKFVSELVPDAKEVMSFGIPSFKFKDRQLLYFAYGKNHVSFFIGPEIISAHREELGDYVLSKSGFQLKLTDKIPFDLMEKFILLKMDMINEKVKKK